MTQLFQLIVLNSLVCLGVHCITRDGMIFGRLADWLREIVGEMACKPLFDCPPCMASIWGIIGWFYLAPDLHLMPYLLVLCGVNALLSKIYYYGIE